MFPFFKNHFLWLSGILYLKSFLTLLYACLLYTSDAADEEDSVDLGGRRIIKQRNPFQLSLHI